MRSQRRVTISSVGRQRKASTWAISRQAVEVAAEAVYVEPGLGERGEVDGLADAVLHLIAAGGERALARDGADESGPKGGVSSGGPRSMRSSRAMAVETSARATRAKDLAVASRRSAAKAWPSLSRSGLSAAMAAVSDWRSRRSAMRRPISEKRRRISHALARRGLGRRGLGLLLGFRDHEHGGYCSDVLVLFKRDVILPSKGKEWAPFAEGEWEDRVCDLRDRVGRLDHNGWGTGVRLRRPILPLLCNGAPILPLAGEGF